MTSLPSEPELLAALNQSDELVLLCTSGKISFPAFLAAYDDFYWSFALDGHESDPAGLAVLAKHSARIAPHQFVAENILSNLCADTDALTDAYRDAGRFGSTEALARLKLVAAGLPGGEA